VDARVDNVDRAQQCSMRKCALSIDINEKIFGRREEDFVLS